MILGWDNWEILVPSYPAKNPNGVQKGVKVLTVDGVIADGNMIPFDPSKKEVTVEVIMG